MSYKSVRTVTGYSSGKRYIEFSIGTVQGTGMYVGLDDGTQNYVSPRTYGIGEDTNYTPSVSYKSSGRVFSKTPSFYTPSEGEIVESYASGDTLSMLVDLDVGTVEFWKNGVSQQVIDYPSGVDAFVTVSLGSIGQEVTANLTQDVPFVYTAPAGYTDWAGNAI